MWILLHLLLKLFFWKLIVRKKFEGIAGAKCLFSNTKIVDIFIQGFQFVAFHWYYQLQNSSDTIEIGYFAQFPYLSVIPCNKVFRFVQKINPDLSSGITFGCRSRQACIYSRSWNGFMRGSFRCEYDMTRNVRPPLGNSGVSSMVASGGCL